MASTYIDIKSSASNQASYTRRAIDSLQSTVNQFGDCKVVFDSLAADGAWDTLGAYLGVSAANAQTVYNLWAGAVVALADSNITGLLSRAGNG